jgi:hypothetical protein
MPLAMSFCLMQPMLFDWEPCGWAAFRLCQPVRDWVDWGGMGFPHPFMVALLPFSKTVIDGMLGSTDLGLGWLVWRWMPSRLNIWQVVGFLGLWLALSRAALELQVYLAPWVWDRFPKS